MDTMNWGVWFRGLISSISLGCLTALGVVAVLSEPPALWKLFTIAGIPVLFNFFSYLKQSPPPFGYKLVKDETINKGGSK